MPRPRWLGRLLPVFSELAPLRVELEDQAASALGQRLLPGLADVFARAGAEAGLRVLVWPRGLVVGGHNLERLPRHAQATIYTAEPWPGSLELALRLARHDRPGSRWLALGGDPRRLDANQRAALETARLRLAPLPFLSLGDAGGERWLKGCARLAQAIAVSYREAQQ